MNTRIKEEWVKALESGEYKQAQGSLSYGGGYCCLGVLCDLYIKETGKAKWFKSFGRHQVFQSEVGSAETYLPTEVISWAELDNRNPRVAHSGRGYSLGEFNDSGKPFSVIASIIKEQL